MASQKPFNPTRFIQARQLARQTPASLASLLGVPVRRVELWEAGKIIPPIEILEEISGRFGQVLPSFFFQDDPPSFPMGSLLIHERFYSNPYVENETENGEESKPTKPHFTSKRLRG